MLLLVALAFCRVVIGLVFGLSFFSKVVDLSAFEQTIIRFALLPQPLSRLFAWVFLGGELAVAVLVALGGALLGVGFLLGAALLLVFSGALVSVLRRHIQTPCNCFGATEKPVSSADVWRNVGFLLCALGGSAILAWSHGVQTPLGLAEWSLIGLGGGVFVAFWLHLGAIVQLLQQR